jgi:hypothetical protein
MLRSLDDDSHVKTRIARSLCVFSQVSRKLPDDDVSTFRIFVLDVASLEG